MDVLTAFSSDHSPLLFSLDLHKDENTGKGCWKFNNSLIINSSFLKTFEKEGIMNFQARCEFFKCKIGKSSIDFSKLLAQNNKKETGF